MASILVLGKTVANFPGKAFFPLVVFSSRDRIGLGLAVLVRVDFGSRWSTRPVIVAVVRIQPVPLPCFFL